MRINKKIECGESKWVPYEIARQNHDIARQHRAAEPVVDTGRRRFIGGFLTKTFAVGAALFGLSNIAFADPFCCDLIYPDGGDCGASGCAAECDELPDSQLLCWTCGTVSCCECMVTVNSDSCWQADEGVTCSCYSS